MIRTVLKYLMPLLLGITVLLAALYLDATPRIYVEDAPSAQTRQEETLSQTQPATEQAQPSTEPAQPEQTQPQEERFTLTFLGDCTLGCHTAHTHAGYGFLMTVEQDYAYPFRNVAEYLKEDDFTLANLEGTLCDTGSPVGMRYSFRGPVDYVNILTENSIEAVSLANNHANDYGPSGYAQTKEVLEGASVPYVERDGSALISLENGLTIGLYAAVYYAFDEADMVSEIAALRQAGADLVIFVPHWGDEGCYDAKPEQIDLAHKAIDAGADIVCGSHPHVLQPIEEYHDGIIYYSLGNFCFGGNIYPDDYDTAVLQQEVIRAADGTVSLGELTIIPCSISSMENRNNYQPTPYAEDSEAYARVLRKLDGTFEGSNLRVS